MAKASKPKGIKKEEIPAPKIKAEELPTVNQPVEPAPEPEPTKRDVPLVMTSSLVTAEVIRSSHTEPPEDTRMVKVKIEYPEGYKGKRFFKDGDVKPMSPETAEVLIKNGIAKKVE